MRLISIIFLVLFPVLGLTNNTHHFHGDRSHSHPLPASGLKHTHQGLQHVGSMKGDQSSASHVHTPVTQKISVRSHNIDDIALIYLNGQNVVRKEYLEDSKWVDITNRLQAGSNKLRFVLKNGNVGGWTYGFQIKVGERVIWEEACGQAGRMGCNDNDTKAGTRFDKTVTIKNGKIVSTYDHLDLELAKREKERQQQEKKREKAEALAAKKRYQKQLAQNLQQSKQHFRIVAGFSKDEKVSKRTRSLPNLSPSVVLSPNVDQNKMTFPIVVAAKSVDRKPHVIKLNVILEMVVDVYKQGCAGMFGHCEKRYKDIVSDSKIVEVILDAKTIYKDTVYLSLTNTELQSGVASYVLNGYVEKTPSPPKVRYEVLEWN